MRCACSSDGCYCLPEGSAWQVSHRRVRPAVPWFCTPRNVTVLLLLLLLLGPLLLVAFLPGDSLLSRISQHTATRPGLLHCVHPELSCVTAR